MLTDTKSTPTQAPVVNDSTAAPSSAPSESKSLVSADLKTALTLLKDIIGTVDSLPEDHKEVVVSSDKFTTVRTFLWPHLSVMCSKSRWCLS